jgi:hypothetical protein
MTLLFPILFEIPEVFTGKESPSLSQDLKHQRINEFQSQPQTNELLQIPILERQPRHSLPQYHNSHLTLHNAIKGVAHKFSEFCIIFTTNLWHKVLCSTLSLQCNGIVKKKNALKAFISPTFLPTFYYSQQLIKHRILSSPPHHCLLPIPMSNTTSLQIATTVHPSTI